MKRAKWIILATMGLGAQANEGDYLFLLNPGNALRPNTQTCLDSYQELHAYADQLLVGLPATSTLTRFDLLQNFVQADSALFVNADPKVRLRYRTAAVTFGNEAGTYAGQSQSVPGTALELKVDFSSTDPAQQRVVLSTKISQCGALSAENTEGSEGKVSFTVAGKSWNISLGGLEGVCGNYANLHAAIDSVTAPAAPSELRIWNADGGAEEDVVVDDSTPLSRAALIAAVTGDPLTSGWTGGELIRVLILNFSNPRFLSLGLEDLREATRTDAIAAAVDQYIAYRSYISNFAAHKTTAKTFVKNTSLTALCGALF